MKIYWEVICREKGCNGYNREYPEIVYCKNKREAYKRCEELKQNPIFEAVFVQAHNGEEIVDI